MPVSLRPWDEAQIRELIANFETAKAEYERLDPEWIFFRSAQDKEAAEAWDERFMEDDSWTANVIEQQDRMEKAIGSIAVILFPYASTDLLSRVGSWIPSIPESWIKGLAPHSVDTDPRWAKGPSITLLNRFIAELLTPRLDLPSVYYSPDGKLDELASMSMPIPELLTLGDLQEVIRAAGGNLSGNAELLEIINFVAVDRDARLADLDRDIHEQLEPRLDQIDAESREENP